MNVNELLCDLRNNETDLDGVIDRFSGDDLFYATCVSLFLEDRTMSELESALDTRSWDDAFTAAHALKGLAGNLGFIPLFHACAEIVVQIRDGHTANIPEAYEKLRECYDGICKVIRRNCEEAPKKRKGDMQ